ncbi:MAG: hypothetical protein R6X20_05835 [Phycisphaerae bacterium]
MTLTRSRKIILAVLAVAVVALVVDRLVLAPPASGPKHARAAPTPSPADTAAKTRATPSPAAATPSETVGRPALAERLEATAERFQLDPETLRDGFVPSQAWLVDLVEPAPEAAPEAVETQASPAEQFAEQHTLTSVILTTGGGSAVIDGKVVPVGQVLDGFRLTRLTRSSAVFEADGEEVELRLRR